MFQYISVDVDFNDTVDVDIEQLASDLNGKPF